MRFTYNYLKMPVGSLMGTRILEVFTVNDKKELSPGFLNYDTSTITGEHYILPDGKLIIVLLITKNHLWTTVRSWNDEKEKYYRKMRGKIVYIALPEKG